VEGKSYCGNIKLNNEKQFENNNITIFVIRQGGKFWGM
jgi:hypothetical protein